MLPKKPKKKWKNLSKCQNVSSARSALLGTEVNGSLDEIKAAREELNQQDKNAEAEFIESQVRIIEDASYSS